MAIEERAADAAIENAVERLMMRLGMPLADELPILLEAANAQTFVVGRTAAKTAIVRRVSLLNAFHPRNRTTSGKNARKWRSNASRESTR